MNRGRGAAVVTLVVAALMVTSVMALPMLGASFGDSDEDGAVSDDVTTTTDDAALEADGAGTASASAGPSSDEGEIAASADDGDASADLELVSMESVAEGAATDTGGDAGAALSSQQEDAVESGVDEGIELAQSQGVEVTQEQRAAAIEGASESAAQQQEADAEQVQEATKGAVHGSLMQAQQVEAEQIQFAVGGATGGALAQYQTVSASQMQSATWGATHGALAQEQRVTIEQIQVATYGSAAGAASEAGDKDIAEQPKIQEAAQGAAYGVLEQYQKITVEQRQQVTLEHVQHAAAGASAGALEGSTEAALEQDQRIDVEQQQRVDIKQVQKAATGAAKGALVQRQEVTVEQTQSAARGAGKGSLKQIQTVDVEQIQRVSITQIQEASFGAAKGSLSQSQEATVEQIQAAADGAAGGVLVQQQEVSITQIQYAAVGAAEGSIEGAIQQQVVEVEQIQAAAFGAGEGAVIQTQVVDVTQVQTLASGSASGVLVQHQEATIEQLQIAASSACQETARVVQYQQISITQLQILTQETASDATAYAVGEGITDSIEIGQYVEIEVEQRIEQVEELEGEASITFADQESDGQSVAVDSVDLSEGGFVAIYQGDSIADPAAVIGSSSYLEAGSHGDVEIDLDEPIEDDQPLVAVVHHDTTGDETFQYAESDGADDEPYVTPAGSPVVDTALVSVEDVDDPEPEATLEVSDQTGDGETLTVDEASAETDFTVTAAYDDEGVESEQFAAEDTQTDFELDLEPPIEEDTTVDVAVVGEDGEELETESLEYTLEDEPPAPDPEVTLNVSDQTGDGETVIVEEANAAEAYSLTVTDEDGEQRGESDAFEANETAAFEANETAAFEAIDLEPPLEANATLEVALVNEAGEELAGESLEYTVDGDPETFEATFVDCQQAEVTGSFEDGDMIIVATAFYESSGFGNTLGEYAITVGDDVEAPFDGTLTYETGEEFTVEETAEGATVTIPEGDFGAAITGFASPDAVGGEIDHPNPDASDCIEEVRPELPDIFVEETTSTDDGIEVTFGSENPNDAALLVGSEFVEGTTEDEPVDELEPGTETFTVEWTPEDDDEQLIWAIDMANYDYELDAVEPAATTPAGEIDPADDAEFTVSITDTNTPVEQGESLEVEADLENVGGEEATQSIELAVDDTVVNTTDVSLVPNATESTTLTAETDDLEAGEYTAAVSSENETAETTVTVETTGESEFAVTDLEAPESGEAGEEVTVDAIVENVGDLEGTQTVSYSINEQLVDEEGLALEAGQSATVSFASVLPDGDSTHTVATEDDEASVTIAVDEPDPVEEESPMDEAEPTEQPPTEEPPADEEAEPPAEPPVDDGPPADEPDETEDEPAEPESDPTDEPADDDPTGPVDEPDDDANNTDGSGTGSPPATALVG